MDTYRILSIDAWSLEPGAWSWNNWHHVGNFPCELTNKSPRMIFAWLRKAGYLTASSAGKVAIEDDQANLVIVNRITREPLLAIDYASCTDEA